MTKNGDKAPTQPVSTNPRVRDLQRKRDAHLNKAAALDKAISLYKEADGILEEEGQ